MLVLVTILHTNQAQADNDPVKILDVQTDPVKVKVGDTFSVDITILNNFSYPVYLTSGACTPAFSVEFDSHAKKIYANMACTSQAILQKVDPQSVETVSSANKPGIIYQAVQGGTASVNTTLPYFAKNQTAPDYSNIYYTASKSFQFQIYDTNETKAFTSNSSGQENPFNSSNAGSVQNKTMVLEENMTVSRHSAHVSPLQLLPLEQFKEGISPKNVQCNDGLILVFKAEDKTPACVKPDSITKLLERGWLSIHDLSTLEMTMETWCEKDNPPSQFIPLCPSPTRPQ